MSGRREEEEEEGEAELATTFGNSAMHPADSLVVLKVPILKNGGLVGDRLPCPFCGVGGSSAPRSLSSPSSFFK